MRHRAALAWRLAVAWLGENGVMGLWHLLAAVLVVGMAVLFAVLFAHRRRRIRYLLRNRLTPLTVLSEELTPVDRWMRTSLLLGAGRYGP